MLSVSNNEQHINTVLTHGCHNRGAVTATAASSVHGVTNTPPQYILHALSPDAEQSLEARDQARHEETGVDDLSRHQRIGGAHGWQQNERNGDDSTERRQEMLEYANGRYTCTWHSENNISST